MKKLRWLYRFYFRIYNLFVSKEKKKTHYFFYSYEQYNIRFNGLMPYSANLFGHTMYTNYFKDEVYSEMVSIFDKYEHCNNDYSWSNWDDVKLLGFGNYNDAIHVVY